jgi:hypothetical protein
MKEMNGRIQLWAIRTFEEAAVTVSAPINEFQFARVVQCVDAVSAVSAPQLRVTALLETHRSDFRRIAS